MCNGELSRFGVELYYFVDEFRPSFLCTSVIANERGVSIQKTMPSVFQKRNGPLVNDCLRRLPDLTDDI